MGLRPGGRGPHHRIRDRRARRAALAAFALVVLGSVGALVADRQASDAGPACTRSWATATSGAWGDAARWSPAGVPTADDDVCITLPGSYQVRVLGDATVRSVQLGGGPGSAVGLSINPCDDEVELVVSETMEVLADADVTLISDDCSTGSAVLRTGGLTNDGTILSEFGTGGERLLTGPVLNRGVLDASYALTYGEAGDTFENRGTVRARGGLLVRGATFDHADGTIEGDPAVTADQLAVDEGATFIQRAGTTTDASVVVRGGSTLRFADGVTGASAHVLRGDTVLEGDVPASATVTVEGVGCTADAASTVTTPGAVAIAGTLVLTTSGCDDGGSATLAAGGAVSSSGSIVVQRGALGSRAIATSRLQSSGSLRIEAGAPLDLSGDLELQAAGTFAPELGPGGAGRVAVAGTATFGGTLAPVVSGSPPFGTTYLVATHPSASGRFAVLDAPGQNLTERYGADQLLLAVLKPTTVGVAVDPPGPALAGSPVTLTATVAVEAPLTGDPTGSVSFFDGDRLLGTSPLDGAGAASITAFDLAAGTRSLTAEYEGDLLHAPGASGPIELEVVPALTTTVLTSSANPSAAFDPVTFTATVSVQPPWMGVPSGQVTFIEGPFTLAVVPLDETGRASTTVGLLLPGTRSVRAVYSGDALRSGSSSGFFDQVVQPLTTEVVASSSPQPSREGEAVQLRAAVIASSGRTIGDGTVTFLDDGVELGTVPLISGQAELDVALTGVGVPPTEARYSGAFGILGSSTTFDHEVVAAPVPTSTELVVAPSSLVATQPVVLTATVAERGGAAVGAGSVSFFDGESELGTAALTDDGTAALELPRGLRAGLRELRASFPGDGDRQPSTSADRSITVARAQGTFSTVATLDPAQPGTVTFVVEATAAPPASGVPAGAIELRIGEEVIAEGRLAGGRARIVRCFTPACAPPSTTTTTTSTTTSTTTTTTSSPTSTSVPTRDDVATAAARSATRLDVVASYPGDADFEAYRSPPIGLLVDGDAVSFPNDPPPPTTTTLPPGTSIPATTTPTSTPTAPTSPPAGDDPLVGAPVSPAAPAVPIVVDRELGAAPDADGSTDELAQGEVPSSDPASPSAGGSSSSPGATAGRSSSGGAGASEPGAPQRSAIASSVATPGQVSTDPAVVLQNLLLALFLLILSVYPAYLVNNTLAENYDEVLGWFGPITRRFERVSARRGTLPAPVVLALSGLGAAVLFSLLDPGMGWNVASSAVFAGHFVSTVAVVAVYDLARKRYLARRFGIDSRLRAYPAGIVVALLLVAFSRLGELSPGYLFGVFTSLAFVSSVDRREDGRGIAAAALWLFGVSVASWLAWVPVAEAATRASAGSWVIFLDTTLASIWVVGIQAIVFGLLPLRFLDGENLLAWSRPAWAAIYGLGLFALVHSMLRPGVEVEGSTYLSAVLLFVLFTLLALCFWAYFRWRTDGPDDAEPSAEGPAAGELVDA